MEKITEYLQHDKEHKKKQKKIIIYVYDYCHRLNVYFIFNGILYQRLHYLILPA